MNYKVVHYNESVIQYFETEERAKLYASNCFNGESKVVDCLTQEILHNFCSKDIKRGKIN